MMDQQLEDLDLVTFVLLNLAAEDEANKLELNNNQVSDFFLFQDIGELIVKVPARVYSLVYFVWLVEL